MLLAVCLGAGCATAPPISPEKVLRIDHAGKLAGKEWFWGVYVMKKRIGYSYLTIQRDPSKQGVLKIISILKLDSLEMVQIDYMRPDLTLLRTEFAQTYDKKKMRVTALASGGKLEVHTTTKGESKVKLREMDHSVYPSSVINILPIVRGLWVGNSYRYRIYQPETNSIRIVKQQVKSYGDLEEFDRAAYRLLTKLKGLKTQSWIDDKGNTLMEQGKLGFLKMSSILENP